jgi:hypothetical protein
MKTIITLIAVATLCGCGNKTDLPSTSKSIQPAQSTMQDVVSAHQKIESAINYASFNQGVCVGIIAEQMKMSGTITNANHSIHF